MEYKIQSLILPSDEKHQQCRKLFYRGDHAILDREHQILKLGYAQHCDFVTYMNACSYRKWQYFTNAGRVTLHIDFLGEAEFDFIGYHKRALTTYRVDFASKKFATRRRKEITFEFPKNNEQLIGFEVTALKNCTIYGGYFTVSVDEKNVRDVKLAVATTTCKKEEYIKKNVALLTKNILEEKNPAAKKSSKLIDDKLRENFFIHVVDNGQTLKKSEIVPAKFKDKVFLHPNLNAGGAGGFARGMSECLKQTPKATHVLIMDDDILVLPESIRRTYAMLKLVKDEFKDRFISGAMLNFEKPQKQYEDVGYVEMRKHNYFWGAMKSKMNQEKIENNLENELPIQRQKYEYAAWWYCCIPCETIKKHGLPMPFFIHCDDVEYSIRAKAKFITLNGIAVWHMGFQNKNDLVFNMYANLRNLLIAQATTGVLKDANLVHAVWNNFRVELLQFDYNGAELAVMALEDFLRGPEWLMETQPSYILGLREKYNDKMEPLDSLPEGQTFNYKNAMKDDPRRFIDKVLLKVTWNGQKFTPRNWERPGVVPISSDFGMQPQKITLHNKLIAVNTYERTGTYRIKNKKKFRELMRRWKKAAKLFKKTHAEIESRYRKASRKMTSEMFWNKYLELDK